MYRIHPIKHTVCLKKIEMQKKSQIVFFTKIFLTTICGYHVFKTEYE